MRHSLAVALAATATLSAVPLRAEPLAPECVQGCTVRLTPAQLLVQAERFVLAKDFETARPMVAALSNIPDYAMQTHFLSGYIDVESGNLDGAIAHFRAALVKQPKATRVRLELARAMMLRGKDGGADYNYRLAEQDDSLPPEILATVKAARNLLRDRRPWHLTADFGVAPDTNITGGTSAETIDVTFGNQVLPFTLQGNSRRRSGIGQTGSISAGYRFALSTKAALLVDGDVQGVNYEGESVDDYTGQLAVGPQYRFDDKTSISLQGIATQRYYGGARAATQFGGRGQLQHLLSRGQRIGLTFDGRRTNSGFSPDYDGWSVGVYGSYERIVMHSFIASASVYARTDRLRSPIYSNREFGINLGIGGELAHGVNAGISGGVGHAIYEAPLLAFSADPRRDWRYTARVYAGLRSVRILGLSPSITFNYSRNASSTALYDTDRKRFAFTLAKYF